MKSLKKLKKKNLITLVRVDYNVDFSPKGKVIDDSRIRASIPTLKYLDSLNSKIIIATHLGRPKIPTSEYSTIKLKPTLERLLGKRIIFVKNFLKVDKEIIKKIDKDQLILLENLRFFKGEEKKDLTFAKNLASLADIFIFEAFSVAHRDHTSVVILPKLLESYYGFQFEKEVKNLNKVMKKAEKPIVVILGGAKEKTKFPLIKNWLKKADHIILGGILANDFLKAKGVEIGKSHYNPDFVKEAKTILKSAKEKKIILPEDVSLLSFSRKRTVPLEKIHKKDIILDIGAKTIKLYISIIKRAKTIIYNGPLGYIEDRRFRKGTEEILKSIAYSKAYTIIGGGETLIILNKLKLANKFGFVSTGGGAMLEFLSGNRFKILKIVEDIKI